MSPPVRPRFHAASAALSRFSAHPLQAHERGMLLVRALTSDARQWYLLYVPRDLALDAAPLVVVHGAARDAVELATWAVPVAEAYGVALIAPIFGLERHGRFQDFGRPGGRGRADEALDAMLAQVWMLTHRNPKPVRLLGHGAGADFALRYAALRPGHVARLALCHPRRLLLPETAAQTSDDPSQVLLAPADRGQLGAFVSLPIRVWTGEVLPDERDRRPGDALDDGRGPYLKLSARAWSAAMHDTARELGVRVDIACHGVPGADGRLATSVSNGVLSHATVFLLG